MGADRPGILYSFLKPFQEKYGAKKTCFFQSRFLNYEKILVAELERLGNFC
jgi:hypothetical protein